MKPVAVVSAGPVTAAAVILPADFKNTILNDSKQLSEKQERNYVLLSNNKPSPLR
jgi:ribonuclease HII